MLAIRSLLIRAFTVRVSDSLSPIVVLVWNEAVDLITRLSEAASPRFKVPLIFVVPLRFVVPLKSAVPVVD